MFVILGVTAIVTNTAIRNCHLITGYVRVEFVSHNLTRPLRCFVCETIIYT
jgi:hypothetical protein